MISQLQTLGKNKYYKNKIMPIIEKLATKELTPYDFFDILDSSAFAEVFDVLRQGEETVTIDVEEAAQFAQSVKKKHGWASWDGKKSYAFNKKRRLLQGRFEQATAVGFFVG